MIQLESILHSPGLLLVFLALFVFVTSLIARRSDRKRLGIRLAAGLFSACSLYALALQPNYLVKQKSAEGILLTPGAELLNDAALDSISNSAVLFALPGIDSSFRPAAKIKFIPDAGYLKRHHPHLAALQVFGHGARDYDWAMLDSVPIIAHLAQPALGIQAISWQRDLFLGEMLQIQGSIAGLQNESYTLYAVDPGGVVDSLKMSAGNNRFDFAILPRTPGRFLYALLLRSSNRDTLAHETLDVMVRQPSPLSILILQAGVRFETKYFKNWLSRSHHSLAVRSMISRDRARAEFVNLSEINLQPMTSGLLRRFDLILADGKTLQNMSAHERRNLQDAVREGLGILLIPDEVLLEREMSPGGELWDNFQFEHFSEIDHRMVKLLWPGVDTLNMTAIPAEPLGIKNMRGLQPLIQDESGHLLAAAQIFGNGKIGVSLIRDTYRWRLEGRTGLYAAYWSYLLSVLSRGEDQSDQWNLRLGKPVLVDQPVDILLTSAHSDSVGLISTGDGQVDSIFFSQDTNEPTRRHGMFWPRAPGWHVIATPRGDKFWFYVSRAGQWRSWQQTQKIAATLQHHERFKGNAGQQRLPHFTRIEKIPLIWFFATFLLSAGYLWLERRMKR